MTDTHQSRLRDFGHRIGRLEPGGRNAITDVAGLLVGQSTVVDDAQGIYSGVTAIVPTALTERGARSLPAGLHVGNGYGKFVGATQVMELGELETPVLLTATLSTFRVADALLTWLLDRAHEPLVSVNPVVGEVNNGWLSTGDPRPVTAAHVHAALDGAGDAVEMGNVGGGTGACALGFKAGIGTASRRVELSGRAATVGVLVQANMGGDLRLPWGTVTPESLGARRAGPSSQRGSCVVVLALDIPCSGLQLSRIATRGVLALGRVGASYSHGSGDYGLAFSSVPSDSPRTLTPAELDTVFAAALESTEEAVIDALLAARTIRTPAGREAVALPHEALRP
ncbi:P1 family peptidase [Streptomyces sp. NRRL F-5126]|uniref:P1 family peptidase n=1 Tax=Streptomyces sp. NRRL F-5126 TaxID=1463857 RepID=UPI0004C9A6E9|nr:P1 family peptidase [Streptomyces sp. NRRL F-5126]